MYIKKRTEFIPPAPLPSLVHDGEPAQGGHSWQEPPPGSHSSHLHSSLQCSEPGLLLFFKNFCSTQSTRTAAIFTHHWTPKSSSATPGIPGGGGSARGTAEFQQRGRHQDILQDTQDLPGIYLPFLSSLCREETPCMGKTSHVLLMLVLWGKRPFPQLHIVLFFS